MSSFPVEKREETAVNENEDDGVENYLRISLLLMGVSPRAVRIVFDSEFSPVCLQATLKRECNKLLNLKTRKIINQAQWNILFPQQGYVESKNFDVSLMICLIRNLTNICGPRKGYDCLPEPLHVSPGDDLARIKVYRNTLAHLKEAKIDNVTFNKYWSDIAQALGRFGGAKIEDECLTLRTRPLDRSSKEILLEVKHLREEIQEIQDETVAWNIRELINAEIQKWQEEDKTFVNTRAATLILHKMKCNSCVAVTGSSGMGKTATVRHVALQIKTEGYDIIPVTDPGDIISFYHPNKNILFVIEDFCGKFSIRQTEFENWENKLCKIKIILKNQNCKLIVCCRLQVYKDLRFEVLALLRSCECNLLSKEMCLSDSEKKMIAEMYLKEKAINILSCDKFDCFPLLCKLSADNAKLIISDFFESPFKVYENELRNLSLQRSPYKYCALAIVVMFNNRLSEEYLTHEINESTRSIIKNTCDACKLSRGTSPLLLRDELNSMINTFVKLEDGFYTTIHDKLFDFLAYHFGNTVTACLIKNAQTEVIEERFLLEQEIHLSQFLIILPEKCHEIYMERLADDWSKGKIRNVFRNHNLRNLVFRKTFFSYIESLDISYQRELAHKIDKSINSTVLISCSFNGYIAFVEWCLNFNVDVNLVRKDGISPLYMACQNGHTEIVNTLLNNKAKIDVCAKNDGASPLFIACRNGHKDIVNILLNNGSEIDKCLNTGESPLFNACRNGQSEIVNMLLTSKADIDKCLMTGETPLFAACRNGHSEVVNMLLSSMADINRCNNNGVTPLFIACQFNHFDIVSLLLHNNADINMCNNGGISPLFIACQFNHINIVASLLSNNADINKYTDKGATPLHVACQNKHKEIVEMLINNKVNIDKCMKSGVSPFMVACQSGEIKIVKMLVKGNADIHSCTSTGVSPFFVACQLGHTDIVKYLINNEAVINNCRNDGSSPVHIACSEGNLDVVNILLENNADINMCMRDGRSPLYCACEKGYTSIVRELLKHNAGVNKCLTTGESPLYIACQIGYAEITEILLAFQSNIDICTFDEETPLYTACEKGHTEIVNLLLRHKADISRCRSDGTSILDVACEKGHKEIVKMLLENNADITKCISDDKSPSIIASENGLAEITEVLL